MVLSGCHACNPYPRILLPTSCLGSRQPPRRLVGRWQRQRCLKAGASFIIIYSYLEHAVWKVGKELDVFDNRSFAGYWHLCDHDGITIQHHLRQCIPSSVLIRSYIRFALFLFANDCWSRLYTIAWLDISTSNEVPTGDSPLFGDLETNYLKENHLCKVLYSEQELLRILSPTVWGQRCRVCRQSHVNSY